MSSPFASFRKHQTYWMAGLVLLAILAFIVAPAIDSMMGYLRSSSHPDNEVVVRWSDGKITAATLSRVRTQHARTARFLQALGQKVVEAGGMPKVPGFFYDPTSKQLFIGLPSFSTNREVCKAIILSDRAKQLGIEFDQSVTEDYIRRYCDRKITPQQFDEILRESSGRELTVPQLHRQLALELSASVMYHIALSGVAYEGMPLATPGNVWEDYLRLSQSARIEAYPILTKDFVKQVKETPTEAEIRQLYDAGTGNFPSPNSPLPAFRRRYQANIEYVSGSWNKLLEVEKTKISEEALRAEYDRQIGLGALRAPANMPEPGAPAPGSTAPGSTPEAPPSPATPPSGENKPDDSKAADKPSEGQPPAPEPASSPAQPAQDQPGEVKPEADKPAQDKSEQDKSEQDKPEQDKPDNDEAQDAEAPAADSAQSQSRAARTDGQIRLVAFQQADQEKKDDLPPPVENPPSPENLIGGDSASAPGQAAPGAAPAAHPSATPSATAPMRALSFEEARDRVARQLARDVVRAQLEAKLAKIQSAMNAYATKKTVERLQAQGGRKSEGEPAKIDLKKLAEAEGLTYGSTGMVDVFRLRPTPVGSSSVAVSGQTVSLADAVMNPNLDLFRPVRSMYVDINMENFTEPDFQEFISWKIDEVPAYIPELKDIRDEVIETWKTQRARELARDQAQKLADKLKSAGEESWKSVLDAQQQTQVVSPPPFSWMTLAREASSPPTISFVQGLDTVGQEFMQRVFSTPPGQVTVGPDEGLNIYYVVLLVELTPTIDQLHQNFEVSRSGARKLASYRAQHIFSDWDANLERTLNVQWFASDESLMD